MSVPIPFLCKARFLTSANVVKNQRACEFHGPLFETNKHSSMWLMKKGQFYSIFKINDELLFLKLNVILIACVCKVGQGVGGWDTVFMQCPHEKGPMVDNWFTVY